MISPIAIDRGRGAGFNPTGRFEKLGHTPDYSELPIDEEFDAPQTELLLDSSKSVLTTNDSPDVHFTQSVNPYRGCEHGCAYCYARPYHEYIGFSAGLDFETKILVKPDAPAQLRKALMAPKYQPSVIAMSGVTDCYQPAERRLKITRGCLKVCAELKNPVGLITKNRLVTRDIDILAAMAAWNGAAVFISVTTLDPELCGQLEPRASRPSARLQAIADMAAAGIPVGVNVAPMIPGLTDHEMPAILKAAREAGARFAGYTIVRLPGAVGQVFEDWLDRNRPDSKVKVLSRIREAHSGRVADARFGTRMKGDGEQADQLNQVFQVHRARLGYGAFPPLSIDHFQRPQEGQLSLF